MIWLTLKVSTLIGASLAAQSEMRELRAPVKIMADNRPIDVERTAHAAPFVGDFDEDGRDDLFVGQFHEGRLRIFRNLGSNKEPKFIDFQWFTAGADLGRVPTG